MRAIVRCNTELDEEALRSIVDQSDWWPSQPQDSNSIVHEKEEILLRVADGDRDGVELNYKWTLHDAGTKSWAIVSKPTRFTYEIRILNSNPRRLNDACENFIKDLRITNGIKVQQRLKKIDESHSLHKMAKQLVHTRIEGDIVLENDIEILEPNSEQVAYIGILRDGSGAFARVRAQRRVEFWIGVAMPITLSLFLLALTHPAIEARVTDRLPWSVWSIAIIGRLATSAGFAAIIGIATLLLYYLDERKRASIDWITV